MDRCRLHKPEFPVSRSGTHPVPLTEPRTQIPAPDHGPSAAHGDRDQTQSLTPWCWWMP